MTNWVVFGCNDEGVLGTTNALATAGASPDNIIAVGLGAYEACKPWAAGQPSAFKAGLFISGLDVGKTQYDGVGSDLWNVSNTGPLHGELAGLTAQLDFTDGKPEQTLKGFSLGNGSSFIQYAGVTVLSYDLNAASGRKLDVTMRSTVSGATAFDLTPSLDLSIGFFFAGLPYESATVDPAFSNARYDFSWAGTGASAQKGERPRSPTPRSMGSTMIAVWPRVRTAPRGHAPAMTCAPFSIGGVTPVHVVSCTPCGVAMTATCSWDASACGKRTSQWAAEPMSARSASTTNVSNAPAAFFTWNLRPSSRCMRVSLSAGW